MQVGVLRTDIGADALRQWVLEARLPALAMGAAALVGVLIGGDALAPSSRWARSLLALFLGHAGVWFIAYAVGCSIGFGGDDPSTVYEFGAVLSLALPATVALVLALQKPATALWSDRRGFLIQVLSGLLGLAAVVVYLVLSFVARSHTTLNVESSGALSRDIAFERGDWLRETRYQEVGGWACYHSCGKQYVPPPAPEILKRRGHTAVLYDALLRGEPVPR